VEITHILPYYLQDDVECVSSRYGVKCVWNKKKESCETFSADVKKTSLEMCESLEPARNSSLECSLLSSCHACLATSLDCLWCSDGCHEARCPQKKDVKVVSRLIECPGSGAKEVCENLHTCDGCTSISRCASTEQTVLL
jgi:hypothetical protein